MSMGLEFAPRQDDAPYIPAAADINPEAELSMIATEQSWQDPETFADVASPFMNHVAMIARRSEELGIVNEYSDELLAAKGTITRLLETEMTYPDFRQFMCACAHDMGMSQAFVAQVLPEASGAYAWLMDDGHGHNEDDRIRHGGEHDDDDEKDSKKKRRLGRLSLRRQRAAKKR